MHYRFLMFREFNTDKKGNKTLTVSEKVIRFIYNLKSILSFWLENRGEIPAQRRHTIP